MAGGVPYTEAVLRRYGSREGWVRETVRRLREWGFNTLGAWSDTDLGISYTINLQITPNYYKAKGGALARRVLVLARNPDVPWQPFGTFPDVFDPEFARVAEEVAKANAASNDPLLVGYFCDNEVDFNPSVIFSEFAGMKPEEPGKVNMISFLFHFFGDVGEFNSRLRTRFKSFDELLDYTSREFQVLETNAPVRGALSEFKVAFASYAAARYVQVCVEAVRRADLNHLVLGARFAGENAREVISSFRAFDVISNNYYGENPPVGYFSRVIRLTGRPVLLSEFSF